MKSASAIILAGGNGERLRPLTRRLVGDDRPKQFCPVVGEETLLDQTRRRAAALITADRTLIVVTREHEPYYAPALAELPARNVVEQPVGRGTAPRMRSRPYDGRLSSSAFAATRSAVPKPSVNRR